MAEDPNIPTIVHGELRCRLAVEDFSSGMMRHGPGAIMRLDPRDVTCRIAQAENVTRVFVSSLNMSFDLYASMDQMDAAMARARMGVANGGPGARTDATSYAGKFIPSIDA